MRNSSIIVSVLILTAAAGSLAGCWRPTAAEVVAYVALDREFSEPILQRFERETGIKVLAKYDVESTKTIGLVNAIIQERDRPRCDLFWNNEIMHTLRLQRLGLLQSVADERAARFPESFRANDQTWTGFAARGRVLVVNTERLPRGEWPTSITALAEEKWRGKCGLAKPLFGTTATHAAVLFVAWGDERARQFFSQVKTNAQILSGNRQVAAAVGHGQLLFGLTDTDDAVVAQRSGWPVEIIFPDQGDGELGTLLIPNTIAVIRGARNSPHAERLREFLLHGAVERELAGGESAQIPLRTDETSQPPFMTGQMPRWQSADLPAAAEQWESAAKFLRDLFETGVANP